MQSTPPIESSYFEQRMMQLGITADKHKITNTVWAAFKKGEEGFVEQSFQIFQPDKEGNIQIYYPTLDGLKMQYKRGTEGPDRISQNYFITRLAKPKGDMKYHIKRGAGTKPFLTPGIIEKFQKKEKIKNLFFTEGSIKAFVAGMHGVDIIGFTSITHLSDTIFGEMFDEVKAVIETCGVERCIWLVDGDCNRLSSKPIDQIDDLYRRPNLFFKSGVSFKQLLDRYDNMDKWFIHPHSIDIPGNPKGIDDLLLSEEVIREDVIKDLNRFDKKAGYEFFHKINITYGTSDLLRYFHLNSPLEFYLYHVEERNKLRKNTPEMDSLDGKDFTFNGTRYRYDPEKKDLTVVTPGEAKAYFRVGDQYHEMFPVPNKYGMNDNVFHRRMKQTIIDDNGPKFLQHIPKYKAFCVVPDHTNFQPVIHHCYNLYHPFEHTPEEGECENTIEFLKHIFGDKEIKYKNSKTGEELQLNELDLGLDYIQLLYQKPTHKLPILCLVSKENATGKSTFAFWLRAIFSQNVAIVGNAELADNFNASWASKLLVICDEAKIDKQVVVEKVKSLSTADKIFMNAKGKDHVEIDFFGKFVFLTNNEENFIYASEEDLRYWIRKVPKIPVDKNKGDILKLIMEEVPAFLNMMNHRKMSTNYESRSWFDPNLIKTDALKRVIAHSQPTVEKEIRSHIREMFFDFPDLKEIMMSAKEIKDEFFKHKNYEHHYLNQVLQDRLKVKRYSLFVHNNQEFESADALQAKFPDVDVESCRKSAVKRYSYPRLEVKNTGTEKTERIRVDVRGHGRPFIFEVNEFLTKGERESRYSADPEMQTVFGNTNKKDNDDLPF